MGIYLGDLTQVICSEKQSAVCQALNALQAKWSQDAIAQQLGIDDGVMIDLMLTMPVDDEQLDEILNKLGLL
ncbi:hypothetical protein [Acinetobacter sp. HY1485]|uniref:hypothetical protein n=1 Tax=Acinetobacter sp. HY1485 TaxID=2970918 RepID=UPI0022B9B84E|nr:hypothetical protein [Acinetobacter sp. HY1485]